MPDEQAPPEDEVVEVIDGELPPRRRRFLPTEHQGFSASRKVQISAFAGAASIVLVWLIEAAGLDLPAEVASAITTLITFATGFIVQERDALEARETALWRWRMRMEKRRMTSERES
jgi:hypothetical protein